jgi:hypothetical protein
MPSFARYRHLRDIKTTFAKLQDIVWPLTRNQEVIYGEEDEDVTCI